MKRIQRVLGAVLGAAVLAASLAGCEIPMPGFADYDVSNYIQSLLDSSYHNSHEGFLVAAQQATDADAAENHATTAENAAVHFCNAYSISPTEQQMAQMQEIFSQVFCKTQYTVREEQKVDTGYYIEVEVTPITNFSNCKADLEQLLNQAQQEADAANTPDPTPTPEPEGDGEYYEEDGWDEWGEEGEDEPESSAVAPTPSPAPKVDAGELYVDKVLEYLRRQAESPAYGTAYTLALNIRQTAEGELQLDLNEIEAIDQAAVQFSQG